MIGLDKTLVLEDSNSVLKMRSLCSLSQSPRLREPRGDDMPLSPLSPSNDMLLLLLHKCSTVFSAQKTSKKQKPRPSEWPSLCEIIQEALHPGYDHGMPSPSRPSRATPPSCAGNICEPDPKRGNPNSSMFARANTGPHCNPVILHMDKILPYQCKMQSK